MGVEDCPLPEVAEALKPFIKPRDEVVAIRRELQNCLQNNLQADGPPLSVFNLATSPESLLDSPPTGLSGVRKAYWKALQAHMTAQAKYDALRTELEQLKHNKPRSDVGDKSGDTDSVNDYYIPVLRQRQKIRKLKAIQKALSDISLAGSDVSTGLMEDVVKKRLGELPTPPSSQPSTSRNPDIETKLLELKKDILSTKHQVAARNSETKMHALTGNAEVPAQVDVAGLQKALQELTSWMENQLTIIANAESESEPVTESPARNGAPPRVPLSNEDIEALYQQYLEARQRLIQTVNESSDSQSGPNIGDLLDEPRRRRSLEPGRSSILSPAEAVLPYIPALVAFKEEEQTLLQQNLHIRHQLSAAEVDTERLIRRLADESHLVQPGATHGKDWAEAAKGAGSETQDFVKERLKVGEAYAKSGKQALDNILTASESLDRLMGNT